MTTWRSARRRSPVHDLARDVAQLALVLAAEVGQQGERDAERRSRD